MATESSPMLLRREGQSKLFTLDGGFWITNPFARWKGMGTRQHDKGNASDGTVMLDAGYK